MRDRRTVEELGPESRQALRRLVLSLADTKRILGIRYSDWLLGAPSIETGIAASSMAQDEWGHARLLYAMLKDIGFDPVRVEHDRPAHEYCSADCLDGPFPDWPSFIAGVVVLDGMLTSALEGFSSGWFDPATSRIGKMVAEEVFHWDLGVAWFRRLGRGSAEARQRLRAAVSGMLGSALTCLAPDDKAGRLMAAEGITETSEAIRTRFRERCAPLLAIVGIDLASWQPSEPDWDAGRSRPGGGPDEEAVVRARGDLNRSLFVE